MRSSRDRIAGPRRDSQKNNLLADAIHQRILGEVPGAEGFYFPDSQYDNSQTLEKMESAVASHLVFVQLVQGIMLVAPITGENYCFKEYTRAMELLSGDPHQNQRLIFVLAEKNRQTLRNRPVSPPYLTWRERIYQKDPPYLE